MIPDDFIVEPATWPADMADLRAVRTEVFVQEQAVPEEEEWDELDEHSQHAIARSADGQPVGTGRLTPNGYIGRMAVVREWRGKGVGAAVLRTLIECARERRLTRIDMHAQTHAIAFYEAAGFVAHGEEFDECGIAHRNMVLELDPPAGRDELPLKTPPAQILSSTNRDEAIAATIEVIRTARRELDIFTRDLDPEVLNQPAVLDALRQVATSGPHTRIRIIVMDPIRARTEGQRLVALAHRLTSVFAFRMPTEEIDRRYAGCFIISDRGAWFERTLATRHDGDGSTWAPGRKAQFQESFNATWERSVECDELRRLEI